MKNAIKNHILRGMTLISIVVSPLSVYSLNSLDLEVLNDQDSIQAIDVQKALKESSFVGAILNRGDGTSCGLIENEILFPSQESTKSHPSALALQNDLRTTLAQHNIPLCSSVEDFQVIEQADPLKTDQIAFEDHPFQLAGLGKFFFSSPLRAAVTSIAGTCLLSAAPWSVVFFFNQIQPKSLAQNPSASPHLFNRPGSIFMSVFISGTNSVIITKGLSLVEKRLSRGGRTFTGITSFLAGIACHLFGRRPVVIVLDSIFNP